MESGTIPVNQSTPDLLKLVSDWIESGPSPQDSIPSLIESIQIIEKRLAFIERNREVIRKYLILSKGDEHPLMIGSYHILSGTLPGGGELILIEPGEEYSIGFSIKLRKIWDEISIQELTEGTEYEYTIELVRNGNRPNETDLAMSTSFEISPYFPGFQMTVKLANEDLIDELVRRRSWIYAIALTLLLGGMILGILLIHRDISREEHLARLRADFISNVTHELKTPLTSIQLFTESISLNRIKSQAQKKEYLQIILRETESLKRMINNILDFARGGKGKREYHFEEIDMSLLLHSAIDDLEYWLVEKKFIMRREIEPHIEAKADSEALKQAIINLLNNAIKFSVDQKEIEVRLKRKKEHILIQVEDKGIGISRDQQELIFQPFYRVGQDGPEEISGTGLGLSVVKEIVEAHQGIISVDSKLNEGSCFTILIKTNQEKQE